MRLSANLALVVLVLIATVSPARAGGGILRMDHRLSMDDDGIWQRRNQWALLYGTAAAVGGLALWEGGDTRLGKTSWQALEAGAMGGVAAEGLKHAFRRERPLVTDDPDSWFKSGSNRSFPSGEVTVVAALVTPYVLEYGRDHPAVYALELLPVVDAVARMKVRAHWQSDVLAGFALGTAAGYLTHSLEQPFVLGVLPRGITVGLKTRF